MTEDDDARRASEVSCEAHSLVQGEECRLEVDETRERSAAEDGEGLGVPPSGAQHGGRFGHGPARDPPKSRLPGAPRKEARREGGCGGQEA